MTTRKSKSQKERDRENDIVVLLSSEITTQLANVKSNY